jgi:hypothetical protein
MSIRAILIAGFLAIAPLAIAPLAIVRAGDGAPGKIAPGETAPTSAAPQALQIHFASDFGSSPQDLRLRGADARQQLLVTAQCADGRLRDFTKHAHYEASPANIVRIDEGGLLRPLGDGTTTVTATADGKTAQLKVVIEQAQASLPVNFPNQIVPIFTKAGCNGGGCHGKSGGQNGFRLSLLGFEPTEDFDHLVRESRGRRVFPAAPQRSLLLLKATAELPHGGGKRLDASSADYALLVRWLGQGMPYGKPSDPKISQITVIPAERTMDFDSSQQLVVMAHYSDGSMEDVTRSALFEVNNKEVGSVDAGGLVKTLRQPGDAAVMVRYQARVAVFRAVVPLGRPVASLPPVRNFIDELVFRKLKIVGMPPSELCDDGTFVRRVTIDVAGRIPTAAEVHRFVADADPAKRDKWIDAQLDSAGYADYFATKWSALLRNKRSDPRQIRGAFQFYDWIRQSLRDNVPYDQFVRQIITASGDANDNPPVVWYRHLHDPNAQVEDVAQLFLGTRMNCAKCHHHPFEKWSQQDYYSLTAFFSTVSRKPGIVEGDEVVFSRRGIASATNPKSGATVKPAGLGATPTEIAPDDDPRQSLADWLSRKDNPLFARALVNRYWKHFLGRGLVEPEDDIRDTNPASNPELLDGLARHFIESGFDLKDLVRTIVRSSTYQLSATPNQDNGIDRQYFSRFYPKRLTAEVLLDAMNQVTRSENRFDGLPAGTRAVELPDNSYNASSYFLTVFGRPDASSACECERSQDASLAQSLHLFNSKDVQEKLTSDQGLPAMLAADKSPEEQKIRELYFSAFARAPEPAELEVTQKYINEKLRQRSAREDPGLTRRHSYEDVVWALLNSKEFLFNH